MILQTASSVADPKKRAVTNPSVGYAVPRNFIALISHHQLGRLAADRNSRAIIRMRVGYARSPCPRTYEHAHAAFTRDGEIRLDGVRATAETNLYVADKVGVPLDYSRFVDSRFQINARRSVRST
jgi:hypothetical protein